MQGTATDLRVGDVLITEDGDEQLITRVTAAEDGVRLWFEGEKFHWLYGKTEDVRFRRAVR